MPFWKHLRAILLLPGMVLGVIPAWIIYRNGTDTFGLWQSLPHSRGVISTIGVGFIASGLVLMFLTIRLFGTAGHGTLAPWNPTRQLVVRGVYRYVRNPMMAGVFSILLGETLLTASLPLACWFGFFVMLNLIFVPLYEERGLIKRFGDEYLAYKRNVPRWIPRTTPWQPNAPSEPSR